MKRDLVAAMNDNNGDRGTKRGWITNSKGPPIHFLSTRDLVDYLAGDSSVLDPGFNYMHWFATQWNQGGRS